MTKQNNNNKKTKGTNNPRKHRNPQVWRSLAENLQNTQEQNQQGSTTPCSPPPTRKPVPHEPQSGLRTAAKITADSQENLDLRKPEKEEGNSDTGGELGDGVNGEATHHHQLERLHREMKFGFG